MPEVSPSNAIPADLPKIGNRRRRGYELTQQRNLLPIVLPAAALALLVHLALWVFAPDVLRLDFIEPETQTVKPADDEERVVVKAPVETELEEAKVEPPVEQQKELDEIPYEPAEIDLLDVDVPEMDMAPGKTELAVPEPVYAQDTDNTEESIKPEQLDAAAFRADPVSAQDFSVADMTPVNANEVVVEAQAQPDELANATSNVEQELRKSAADQGKELPADTRSLSELMGDENLGARSGVARLGADLLFGFNECVLRNSARITMLQLAALIQKNPETYFLIEGHTDSIGTPEYNALLGLQRAAAVREWLVANGIPVQYVYIRSCGNTQPLADTNLPKEQQELNRRVEIHMRKGGETMPDNAVDCHYKVDTKQPVSVQLAAGVKAPVVSAVTLKEIEKKPIPKTVMPEPTKATPKKETKPAAKKSEAKKDSKSSKKDSKNSAKKADSKKK